MGLRIKLKKSLDLNCEIKFLYCIFFRWQSILPYPRVVDILWGEKRQVWESSPTWLLSCEVELVDH